MAKNELTCAGGAGGAGGAIVSDGPNNRSRDNGANHQGRGRHSANGRSRSSTGTSSCACAGSSTSTGSSASTGCRARSGRRCLRPDGLSGEGQSGNGSDSKFVEVHCFSLSENELIDGARFKCSRSNAQKEAFLRGLLRFPT